MFIKKTVFATSLLTAFLAAPLARADGAPATVDSDYTPLKLELNTDSSPIDTRPYKLNAGIEAGNNSLRGATGRLDLSASRKFILGGGDAWVQYGVGLNAAASLKLDASKSSPGEGSVAPQNVEVRAGGASAFVVSVNNRPSLSMPNGDIKIIAWYGRELVTPAKYMEQCRTNHDESLCKAYLARRIDNILDKIPDPAKKPSATFALNVGSAEYMYRNQTDIGAKATGVNFKFAEASTHLAFKINDLPIDLCAQAAFGGVAGAVRMIDRSENAAAHLEAQACVGVQLGRVGRAGYDYKLDVVGNDSGAIVNQSHEASMRKIAGTPLMVSATYETSHVDNASAGSARDTSAEFVKVGGEF